MAEGVNHVMKAAIRHGSRLTFSLCQESPKSGDL